MFSLLIIICLIQLWLVFLWANDFIELRLCFLKATISIFALFAFNTEILSLFGCINVRTVTYLWLTEIFCFFGILLFQNRNDKTSFWNIMKENIFLQIKEKLFRYKAFVILVAVIYAAIFLIAVASAPNTADSQTYHMARVANWVQWGNVNFYPTATLRQLYSGPLAEYGILNIFLLSSNDNFVNLVQFGCLIGCGITISLIVREFKQNGAAQILAVLLTATMPMAILQASSTQNDLVVSFFATGFFLFYLRTSESGKRRDLVFSGLTLGLAFLTKGTAYIYCASIAVVIFASVIFSRLPQKKILNFFTQSLLILIFAVSINSIQYLRNYQLFGSPIATGDDSVVNQNLTPQLMAANVVRNYVIHLGTLFEEPSNRLSNATAYLLGNELNNPDSSYLEIPFNIQYSDHEDNAGNFTQALLLTICLFLVLRFEGKNRKKVLVAAFTIIFGFILFSGLLKWNPWMSRFHLPFFMLGCAVMAAVLNKYSENIKNLIIALCLWSCVNALLMGQPRSIFTVTDSISNEKPRIEQYFANSIPLAAVYSEAVAVVKENNPKEVGLMMENNYRKYNFGDWEYPVWVLFKDNFSDEPLIRHIGLKNISKILVTDTKMPEWIISAGKENVVGGVQYHEVWSKEPLRVLRKNN